MRRFPFLALLCLTSSGCLAAFGGKLVVSGGRADARLGVRTAAPSVAVAFLDGGARLDADGKPVPAQPATTSGGDATGFAWGADPASSGGSASATAAGPGAASDFASGSASGDAPTSGSASHSGSASGSAPTSGSGSASGSGSGSASGSAPTSGSGSASGSGSGTVAVADPDLDVDLFVHGTATGHGHTFGALVGDGLTVDGHVTALADLAPLAATAYAGARRGGDGADGVVVQAGVARDASGAARVVVHLHGAAGVRSDAGLRFVVVLDRSASMASGWGRTVDALAEIVAALPASAELVVVAYGDHAETVYGPARVTDAGRVTDALAHVHPVGGSNVEAGLRAAYAVTLPNGASHVVLVSDGVPDGGAATPDALGALAAGALARGGCTTSVVGIGANVDAGVLRAVAGAGDGAFVLASSVSRLGAALARDLRTQGAVAATDLDVRVRLPAGVHFADGTTETHVARPRLAPGEDATIQLALEGRGAASAGVQVHVDWKVGLAGRAASADASVSLRTPDARAALALLDAGLGAALRSSGEAIALGDTATAAATLRACASAQASTDPAVVARASALERVASVVAGLGAGASWSDRRLVGNAMLALSWRFGG